MRAKAKLWKTGKNKKGNVGKGGVNICLEAQVFKSFRVDVCGPCVPCNLQAGAFDADKDERLPAQTWENQVADPQHR